MPQRHLVMGIQLAVPNKVQEWLGRAHTAVEVVRSVVEVDLLPITFKMRLAHLGKRPCCRSDHALYGHRSMGLVCYETV